MIIVLPVLCYLRAACVPQPTVVVLFVLMTWFWHKEYHNVCCRSVQHVYFARWYLSRYSFDILQPFIVHIFAPIENALFLILACSFGFLQSTQIEEAVG